MPVPVNNSFVRARLNLSYASSPKDGVQDLPELIEFNARYNPTSVWGRQLSSSHHTEGREFVNRDVTFAQLQRAVERCSAWLVHSGVTPGRRIEKIRTKPVALLMGSDISIFIYLAALGRIGTPVLLLSPRLSPSAVGHLIKATGASTVLHTGQVARTVQDLQTGPEHYGLEEVVFESALGYPSFMNDECEGLPIPKRFLPVKRQEVGAVIMHSSGTTGLPKPIYHAPMYLLGYAGCHNIPYQVGNFGWNVSTLPLYHGFGLLAPSLSLSIGLSFVMLPAGVIPTARTTLSLLRDLDNVYSMLTVPSILEDILHCPQKSPNQPLDLLRPLRFIAIGGAPMKESVGEALVSQGIKLLNHWGATEIGAIALIQPPPRGYDWRYLIPRQDLGLEILKLENPHIPDRQPNNTEVSESRYYRLIGHPPGWDSAFHVQDLLIERTEGLEYTHSVQTLPHLRILSRTDDLLVLSTGEKIHPAPIERAVSEHPDVKDALVFVGLPDEAKDRAGLVVELYGGASIDSEDTKRVHLGSDWASSFPAYLDHANSLTPSHGQITADMIVFTYSDNKPLIRTDKGSLARQENLRAFEEQIRSCYDSLEGREDVEAELFSGNDDSESRNIIRRLVSQCAQTTIVSFTSVTSNSPTSASGKTDEMDFFEMGMDSLQATRLRKIIQTSLRKTTGDPNLAIPNDFVFQHSTISKLTHAISIIISSGSSHGHAPALDEDDTERLRVAAMNEMVQKYTRVLKGYESLAVNAPTRALERSGESPKIVLLTGSTGSLGCQLLHKLASDPEVHKVICLNRRRPGHQEGWKYQRDALKKRGVTLSESSPEWKKVVFLESEGMSNEAMGLNEADYSKLLDVTHIIHNAWPVDFNRSLSSFEPHIQLLCSLIQLSLRSSQYRRRESTRLLFTSSIAVVGRFSLSKAEEHIPEELVPASATNTFGYPEAKWVCEELVEAANQLFSNSLRGSSVRIGQMVGPEGKGCWNETEHFPVICRMSQIIGALPEIPGTSSWLPTNRAAHALTDLLFTSNSRPIYHLENPTRQPWQKVLASLASLLTSSDEPLRIIPFADWLHLVENHEKLSQTHSSLLSFLETDFIRMASGAITLGMDGCLEESRSLGELVSERDVNEKRCLEEHVVYWKEVGLLS